MKDRILICLLSCHQHAARQTMCRSTWIPVAHELGYDVVFCIGEGTFVREPERHGDQLLLPCPPGYRELPQRTHWMCRWALGQEWDWLLKADCDSLVLPWRIQPWIDEAPDAEFQGSEWKRNTKYASGAGYLLSRRAAQVLADKMTDERGPEDMIAARHLRRAGIRLALSDRVVPFGSETKRARPDNRVAITHKIGEPLWGTIWQECHEAWRQGRP